MRKVLLVATLATLPMLSAAQQGAPSQPAAPAVATPRLSQEKLDQIRQALAAQIAVRDEAERAMREPTPAEALELVAPATGEGDLVTLPDGGLALKTDGTQLSLAVAAVGADGAVKVTHGGTPLQATTAPKPTKGGGHDR